MVTQNSLKTHFDFFHQRILDEFLFANMFRIIEFLRVFLCYSVFHVFQLLFGFVCRFVEDYEKRDLQEAGQTDSRGLELNIGSDISSAFREYKLSLSTSKHQFTWERETTGVMILEQPEPETINCCVVQEFFVGDDDSDASPLSNHLSEILEEFRFEEKAEDSFHQIKHEFSQERDGFSSETTQILNDDDDDDSVHVNDQIHENFQELISKKKTEDLQKEQKAEELKEEEKANYSVLGSENRGNFMNDLLPEVQALWEDYSIPSDSESDLSKFNEDLAETIADDSEKVDNFHDTRIVEEDKVCISDQMYDSDDEFIELKPNLLTFTFSEQKCNSEKDDDSEKVEDQNQGEVLGEMGRETVESNLNYDCEDEDEYETDDDEEEEEEEEEEDEDDDLLEKLKMEMRNARTGGLPTILEEEDQEIALLQGLKPLKIDEQKHGFKDVMAEIVKVHKNYAEKMRKLDVMNNQTIHAIGFLQLKNPKKPNSSQKSSVQAMKRSIFSHKQRATEPEPDPSMKLVRDLSRDLEFVYVGQICLSWEILHWQHRKAQELQQHYSNCAQGVRRYYQVTNEFQLFQVLLQRFIENEKFQGLTRIENYVRSRCMLRSLLQVPIIKDDCLRDKKVGKGGEDDEEYEISIGMLGRIIEESMQVFWQFLRADHCNNNHHQQNQICDLHFEPEDLQLLMGIRADLQKKERKLKDIMRSSNCIVKKFQKHSPHHHHEEDRVIGYALFIARVELKLVSRVLNMSKLTPHQLLWCRQKLDQFHFVSRRVHLEPSFSLFPC